jgi:hypothetical protein
MTLRGRDAQFGPLYTRVWLNDFFLTTKVTKDLHKGHKGLKYRIITLCSLCFLCVLCG